MAIVFTFIFLSVIGSFFRWLVSQYGPLGVLAVNITGSFFLALTFNWVGAGVTAIGIGALGSFTTFSAFTADAISLNEDHGFLKASGYVVSTLVLSIISASFGLFLIQ